MFFIQKWVRDNIQKFGGNPNNITIFGESAGGSSIVTLLAISDVKRLFHRAIVQSQHTYIMSYQKISSEDFSSMLNVTSGDLEGLQKIPEEDITKAQDSLIEKYTSKGRDNPFTPVVDEKLLLEKPLEAIEKGFSKDVPLLIGTNRDEIRFLEAFPPKQKLVIKDMDSEKLLKGLMHTLSKFGLEEPFARKLIDTYIKEREGILPNAPLDILGAFQTDVRYRIFSTRIAEAQSKHQKNTYMYLFTWPSPWMDGILGSCHGLEIAFVFGTFAIPGADTYYGIEPENDTLSEKMMDAWIAFARTGNPNHENIPEWSSFNSVSRSTIILDKECKTVDDPFGKEREAWEQFRYK